jgi:hypothetical protein
MGIFGWSLPPGCGTLPGEEDDQLTNEDVEQAFSNYEGPWDLYRQTYKYVACGPMVGFTIAYHIEPTDMEDFGQDVTKTFYGDDLHQWGTWKDMAEHGALIVAIGVSSIVEGVDWDVPYREVETDPDKLADKAQEDEAPADTLRRLFWQMVTEVNAEADYIWHDTHGCETCQKHWAEEGLPDGENEYGYVTIWPDCPDCGGSGTII